MIYVLTFKDKRIFEVPAERVTSFLQKQGETPASNFQQRLNQLNTYLVYVLMEPTAVDWTMEEDR